MKNKDILNVIADIRYSLGKTEEKLDTLSASLKEEEVIKALKGRKSISKEEIQKEFQMGYTISSIMIDTFIQKGFIKQIGKGRNYEIIKKRTGLAVK